MYASRSNLAQRRVVFGNQSVGRTPWSARDALVPPVRKESVGCHHREADQGVGCGRGRPPHYLAIAGKREIYAAFQAAGRADIRPTICAIAGKREIYAHFQAAS